MKNQGYFFEIKDLIVQFITAFDNVVINRYNSDRSVANKLQVRYVYSPKQRVIYDLVNLAQNITLPVISVSINSVARSNERVFNNTRGFYFSNRANSLSPYNSASSFVRMPIPVDISVSMSILAKYQTDLDQIISNFVPYTNPYIILSWQIAADFGLSQPYEIRSEVLWDGAIRLSYPTEIAANAKYRVSGDTSFTIKGWLFPSISQPVSNIFNIDSNFYAASAITVYENLTGNTYNYPASAYLANNLEVLALTGISTTRYVSGGILSAFKIPFPTS